MRPQPSDVFAGRDITLFFAGICSIALFFVTLCFVGIDAPVHAAGRIDAPVHAAEGMPQIGLQPAYPLPSDQTGKAYFIFKGNPGASIQNAVRATNSGTVAGNVTFYGADAITGQTTGSVFLEQSASQRDVGRWLTLERSSLTLYPGGSIVVPFKVTLPKKVRSGVHLGGVAMEVTPIGNKPKMLSGNVQIHTRILIIIAVEMILPGAPIEALTATGVEAGGENGYQTLQLALHNTGNQMLKPLGTLQVLDAYGAPLQTLPIKMDTFLPDNSIQYPVYLKQALGDGNYQAILTLTYGKHHTLRYLTPFTITPEQVQRAFASSSHGLQAPIMSASLQPWMFLVGGLLGIGTLLFLIQQRRHLMPLGRKKKK